MTEPVDFARTSRFGDAVGMRLEERFHRTSDDESWEGVRYEVARDGAASS